MSANFEIAALWYVNKKYNHIKQFSKIVFFIYHSLFCFSALRNEATGEVKSIRANNQYVLLQFVTISNSVEQRLIEWLNV